MRFLAAIFRGFIHGGQRGAARPGEAPVQAVAGAAAQELREPLGQLQRSLQAVHEALPPPSQEGSAIQPQELEALYASLARSELALQRALQVGAMLLQETSGRPVDISGLRQLSAADAVQQAVGEFALEGAEVRDRLIVEVLDDFTFKGVESACVFVLSHLAGTGLYHAGSPATRVKVTVGARQIRIRDNGDGLAPELLAGLFDPLRPASKAGATGLGLAHCRRILRAFGAELHCDSAVGEFTEFTLTFPPVSAGDREEHRMGAIAQARTVLGGKRVLIVDADGDRALATRQKLGVLALGTDFDHTAAGQEALARLEQHRYDLVLLELQGIDIDGYDLARRIRGLAGASEDVRILASTPEPLQLARAKAARAGIDAVVGRPCGQLRLLATLQQALQRPAGIPGAARRLAGSRILVAIDSAFNRKAIAGHLRNAAVTVVEVEHGETVLEQLHAHAGMDAVIVDLHMPGMDGLATTRAIRGSRRSWSEVPVVGLTARSDEPVIAATRAAGMNAVLVKPVEAPLLYETLARLLTIGAAAPAAAVAPRAPAVQDGLLNLQRLESYRRLGMLDELLNDYVPEMARLVRTLQQAVDVYDVQGTIAALHSLLGMSGEAGAQALYQEVRKLYVPLLEHGQWPRGSAWLPQLKDLAARTELALRAYCAQGARSGAG